MVNQDAKPVKAHVVMKNHLKRLLVIPEVVNVCLSTGLMEQHQTVPGFGLQAQRLLAAKNVAEPLVNYASSAEILDMTDILVVVRQ